jgi:hypothetical protein
MLIVQAVLFAKKEAPGRIAVHDYRDLYTPMILLAVAL